MKFFAELSFGLVGCKSCEVIEADSLAEAEITAYQLAVENAESYGYYQDEDHFGDLDTVGKDWDEDEECYEQEGFIDFYVEPYEPEKHDPYLF